MGSGIKLLSSNGCSFGVKRRLHYRVLVNLVYCECAKCKSTVPFKIINFRFHEFYHKKTKTHIQSSLDPRPRDGKADGHHPSFPSSAACSPLCPHTCPASPVHAQASSLDCSSWRKRGKEHFKKPLLCLGLTRSPWPRDFWNMTSFVAKGRMLENVWDKFQSQWFCKKKSHPVPQKAVLPIK